MRSSISAALGACLLLAPLAPASASSAADQTVSVSFADLDFTKDGDRRRLDNRVRQAASRLCFTGGQAIVSDAASMGRCITMTVAATKPQMDRAFASAKASSAFAAAALIITLP